MNNNNGIINACAIQGDGTKIDLTNENILQAVQGNTVSWVHLDGNKQETRKWLNKDISDLDHIIVDALLAEETRPRIMEFEQGSLMILRGVNLNENSSPEDMISIRLWIDEHRIISVQRRPLKAVKDIYNKLEKGKGPKNAGDFVALLAARLFERMEPIFTDMDEKLDSIEEAVIENPDISERKLITDIRKKAIIFRRYIAPQRDVIMHLRTSNQTWLTDMHKRKLQESLDRVMRYVEDLEAIRERAQIVKDELSSVLADNMNKNMYVLSVIAAIFLPLGFFTGLMGINIGGMPGVDNTNAFWIFSGVLTAMVVLQVIIFKKLKWF